MLESGATFNDESGTSSAGLTIGGTGTVTNDGTWEKTVGTNTSTISAAFSSTGTSSLNLANVEVATGTLDLTGGGADTYTSYSGAGTIEFGGGTRTLDVNSSITTANAEFSGGTTTINGTFSDPGTITLNGGTLSVAGAVTAGSLVQTSTSSDVLTGDRDFDGDWHSELCRGRQHRERGRNDAAGERCVIRHRRQQFRPDAELADVGA